MEVNHPSGDSDQKGAVMGALLKEIQIMSPKAADALKQAGLESDSDIQSLTREDLHELLPGVGDFKLRKNVFEMIQKLRPANMPLEELGELQKNLASSAQVDSKLDLIIEILVNKQADSKADKGSLSTREDHQQGAQEEYVIIEKSETSTSPLNGSVADYDGYQSDPKSHRICIPSNSKAGTSAHYPQEVKYKMVVGGQTFGAHTQLMDQVKRATKGDIRLLENSDDSQIIIVFCPITSRVELDVKAAMSGVPGDKPVILVKMHHVCESKSSLCFSTSIDDRNIVLQVNVFYHENIRGLLECQLNDTAIYEIQHELLKHSDHRSTETRASTSGQDPKKAKKNKFWPLG